MRNTGAVFAGLVLACVAAFGGEGLNTIERLVPADAVALVQVEEAGKLRAAFEQSALAEAVQASHALRYLRAAAGAAAEFAAALLSGLSASELGACLGPHAGLALLDFKDPADLRARVPVVALVEASDPKKLEATLLAQLQLLGLFRDDMVAAERKHLGVVVREVPLPDRGFLSFDFCGNVLVVGGRQGVEALISSQVGDAPRLAATPAYKAIRNGLPAGPGVFAYVAIRPLLQRIGLAAAPEQLAPLRILGVAGAEAAGLGVGFDGRQVRERLIVQLNGPPTGILRILTEGQPISPSLGSFVPNDYSVVLQVATRDVALWDRLRTLLQDIQGPAAVDFLETVGTHLEKQLGVHPRKGIFDAIGDEAFVALDLGQLSAFYGSGRQPKAQELPLLVGARLRDAAALKDTSDRIAGNQALWEKGVQRTSTRYGETSVFTFRTPMNPEVRISHATVDGVLLFSILPGPVVGALEARKAGKTLAAGPPAQPSHVVLQVNDAALLKSILACIRGELPEAGKRLLPEADRIIAGLNGYHATLRRDEHGVMLEARSDLGTLGTLLAAVLMFDQGNAMIARRVNADFDRLGAALEAYRAKKGEYPETIEQLVPDLVPALANDRFEASRPYGYARRQDAWLLTSVGPDKRPDIPAEQFDPPAWAARLRSQEPPDIALLKRLIYRFHPELYADERKNDDEGDLYRMGGKGLEPRSAPQTPEKAHKDGAKKEDF